MSKFEELCQIYNRSYDEIYDYLEDCVQFVENLMKGMEDYLEYPEKRIQYKNKVGEDKSLREAMYLENGFWHFDTAITMCRENAYRRRSATFTRCYYPRQTVLLPFITKRLNTNLFLVGLDGYPNNFTIDLNDKRSFYVFYDFVFEKVKEYYQNIFTSIISNGESPTKIEFKNVENNL
jgi:hypothetical protein